MQTYIVLLRGINVGGHRKVPMADLRELLFNLNFLDVKTYIQSGNVVLNSNDNSKTVRSKIENAISSHFGFTVVVIVKSPIEFQDIFNASPFSKEEKEKSYFMLLDANPNKDIVSELSELTYENETFKITENCIYFFSSVGYGRTKFNANYFEKKLGVNASARNYKTMLKLLEMSFVIQTEQ